MAVDRLLGPRLDGTLGHGDRLAFRGARGQDCPGQLLTRRIIRICQAHRYVKKTKRIGNAGTSGDIQKEEN
jgi:hypothetical protein